MTKSDKLQRLWRTAIVGTMAIAIPSLGQATTVSTNVTVSGTWTQESVVFQAPAEQETWNWSLEVNAVGNWCHVQKSQVSPPGWSIDFDDDKTGYFVVAGHESPWRNFQAALFLGQIHPCGKGGGGSGSDPEIGDWEVDAETDSEYFVLPSYKFICVNTTNTVKAVDGEEPSNPVLSDWSIDEGSPVNFISSTNNATEVQFTVPDPGEYNITGTSTNNTEHTDTALVNVVKVIFSEAGSGTKAGYDDTTDDSKDWISVGLPEDSFLLRNTRAVAEVQPSGLHEHITLCPPPFIELGSAQLSSSWSHVKITGIVSGESDLHAKIAGCDGDIAGTLGIAAYKNPEPFTRHFVVTQEGNSKPTDYPDDPHQTLFQHWRQAVVRPLSLKRVYVTADYDIQNDGYLDLDDPSAIEAVLSACAEAVGLDSYEDDEEPRAWMIFVKDIHLTHPLYGSIHPLGAAYSNEGYAFIRDRRSGDTHSVDITYSHEFGHLIGADHVQQNGTVMRDVGYTQGDYIPKANWDEVLREVN